MNQHDEHPPGLPPPSAPDRIPMPGFSPTPPPPPGPANPDPPTPGPATRRGGRDVWPAATSTPASTDGDRGRGDGAGDKPPDAPFKSKRATFTKLIETALQAVGGLLNRGLAVDESDECFLPDEDDLATVPPPLGDLAARKVTLPIGKDDLSDAEDMIAAAIGLAAWLFKGLVDWAMARRAQRKAQAGAVMGPRDDVAAQDGARV